MSKKKKNKSGEDLIDGLEEALDSHSVNYKENAEPDRVFFSFEEFWSEFVLKYNRIEEKDGFTMRICKKHLESMGLLQDQPKWVKGVYHFGLKIK